MSKVLLVSVIGLALAGGVAAQSPVELKVGDLAPGFSLPGTDGQTHALSAYRGQTVVLAWYPAAFTGGCTRECKSFRDSGETIKKFDVAYFMASVDTPEKNLEFSKQEEADFPMLSDPAKTVAEAYGVLSPRGVANRWTFYIGPDGRIEYIDKSVNVDTAGQDLADRLAALHVKQK
jgi:thioredoxin-dependent peroxiredoxin